MRGHGNQRHAGGSLYDEVREHLSHMDDVVMEGPPRRRSLRSSSLPYCPVLDVVLPREPDSMDLSGALYTSMGTAAHLALQAFASMGDVGRRCWGRWRCPRCAHKWDVPQFRPSACPTGCSDAPIYEELIYNIGMSGHSDLVVKYRHGWVVHEYKTTGRAPRAPSRRHLLQARTYCVMLRRQYRISASYAIIYVQRENLRKHVFGPYDANANAQALNDITNRSIAGFRAATVARRSPTPDNLLEVARCRPCVDRETHDEYMGRRFEFSKKPCEMLGQCSRSNRHVASIMADLL